ncbi:MAG: hypothetical protein M0R05_07080 [Bacilli bacterium]|nr:hypothetical protein [Bacilli bacterium]MDD4076976.1 hypothetical protein [Bacilli bacterium]
MIKRDMQKFIKTGNVKDYLDYKKKQQLEVSKEIAPGEKNGFKTRNNSKGGEVSGKS